MNKAKIDLNNTIIMYTEYTQIIKNEYKVRLEFVLNNKEVQRQGKYNTTNSYTKNSYC